MKHCLKYSESLGGRCSIKKGVLRNFAKFTGKHLCQSLFFNKVAELSLQNTSSDLKLLQILQ